LEIAFLKVCQNHYLSFLISKRFIIMKHTLLIFIVLTSLACYGQQFDVLIRNGKIIDGTGNAWYYGDIGIKEDKILKIGKLDAAQAKEVIDAQGLIVAPGFIDVHAHIEGGDFAFPTASNFIYDGVTSVVTGNCGGSNLSIKEYFRKLDSAKISINVASLIGHNTVRFNVMNNEAREPKPEELEKMKKYVEEAMQAGAVGLSTGLIYVPGTYAKIDEIAELAKVAAKYQGVYASHIRNEDDDVKLAVEEAISIGRQAKIPVQISHYKVTYKPNWGRSTETIGMVERARNEGIDVTVDQYPYVASSTTLSITVPTWVFSGNADSLTARLKNPKTRLKIKKEMVEMLKEKKEKNFSYAVVARYAPDSTYNGKNISEINILKGRKAKPMDECETILELVASTARTQMIYFSMEETDLKNIMRFSQAMVASDAGIVGFGFSMPHPRAYGTNARVLGKYVREEKIISLEDAIRKMTSFPAQKFRLNDRGMLKEGMSADIVIFDEKNVGDKSTFTKPHAYSTGILYVLVNGKITLKQGKHTGEKFGKVLKGGN
jgi:N-acyl-D-amino-acid deacylase